MENYITAIEELWQTRDTLGKNEEQFAKGKCIIDDIISLLNYTINFQNKLSV